MNIRSTFCVTTATFCLLFAPLNDGFAQGVYIGQMDGAPSPRLGHTPSTGSAGVYLDQVPPTAKPRPAPAPRRAAARPRASAAQVAATAAKRVLPDVGTGVTLAAPASSRDKRLPNVGRGTVGG